ncbi:mechanosensitive ion channel family protein [Halomarina litorea]|uniref:mechanosensitive ion channel family protein n=1 Tax=Halomarina litorea TaxID=2961595 RepID=UPI0020C39607|nr:hypothetical protein [Halomarina sp. BCD28]
MVHTVHTSSVFLLQVGDVSTYLNQLLTSVVAFLPNLIGAILVLLVGWVVGRIVGRAIREVADRAEVDRAVLKTPLGRIMGGTEKAVSSAFGAIARYFVYALALVAAADVLAIDLLSEWVSTAMAYLPSFVAGLLVIVLGFVVADFIGDTIARTREATNSRATKYFASGTKLFLYFMAVVIGLDTMGIDTAILYVFAQAAAYGAGAALAIGVGVALGWGGKDYVANNISRWMGRAGSVAGTSDPRGPTMGPGTTDGGVDATEDADSDPEFERRFGSGPRGH